MGDDWFNGKTLVFKLTDTKSEERMTIWKGWSYKDTQIVDTDGKEMKFPLSKGELCGTDGKFYKFDEIKDMDNKDFKGLFPYFRKNVSHVRIVEIGGKVFKYEFKKKINDELEKLCLMTPGNVPQAFFKQVFDKDEPPMKMYRLDVVDEREARNWLASYNSSSDKPIGPIPKRIQIGVPLSTQMEGSTQAPAPIPQRQSSELELDALEQKLVTAIKGMGTIFDEARFIKTFEQTYAKNNKTINVERVKLIFNKLYKK